MCVDAGGGVGCGSGGGGSDCGGGGGNQILHESIFALSVKFRHVQ